MALTNGTKLGSYEMIAPLGADGMGEVYRALDTRPDRTVAVKILPRHFSDDEAPRLHFEHEAKVISSLNHPNICTLHDVGRQDGVEFIVMENAESESLGERLEKGALPPSQVLQYGAQIAGALDKPQGNGVTSGKMHGIRKADFRIEFPLFSEFTPTRLM
jgi:eukaryotic-like serine/threonine-protein kinase